MKHPTEDALLKYVLNLLEPHEREALDTHLSACSSCGQKLIVMGRETDALAGLEPDIAAPLVAFPRGGNRSFLTLTRIAAILLAGILLGYGLARVSSPPDVLLVAGYRGAPSSHRVSQEFVVCESENLDTRN